MKTTILIVIAILQFSLAVAQSEIKEPANACSVQLQKHKIYIFCRGTTLKQHLVSNAFNIIDSNVTHVGIGYLDNYKIKIFNVTNVSRVQNSLKVEDFESFISIDDAFYYSIWELNMGNMFFRRVKKILSESVCHRVSFDYAFLLNNGDSLYCSEFCAEVINAVKKIVVPTKKAFNNKLYEAILGRVSLEYYPVDFFVNNN